MKTSYLIVCVLLILSGCSNNTDEIISTTQNETENKVEKDYQKALDLVKEFADLDPFHHISIPSIKPYL
ncbi:hypothetical protein [Gabonibacter chumensis]|uniref:hypothetical protein n=1 Tax=Gabonibacter chumensis TaxID=2972474 RepID=UPI002573C755|nr:hypothetical protein [Gabonibacter chumensis]MCR9011192.1 hypothetical protein [Gabonibacter chumensis]